MKLSHHQREPIRFADNIVLPHARVHEVLGTASDSFAILTAAKTVGPIIWIGNRAAVSTLTPQALNDFIDPTRLILIETANRKETLWSTEQALRCQGAALVISQIHLGPDLKESRRLQLAAEQGGGLGIMLIERRAQSSAAQTRWICTSKHGGDADYEGLNSGGWTWELTKNKGGPVGAWSVAWQGGGYGQKGHVYLATATAA